MKRVLLDENVPRGLGAVLRELGLDAEDFPRDWKGLSNGKLLRRMQTVGFDVLLTADGSLAYQQPLHEHQIGVVCLPTNKRKVLISRAPDIVETVGLVRPSTCVLVSSTGRRILLAPSPSGTSQIALFPLKHVSRKWPRFRDKDMRENNELKRVRESERSRHALAPFR